MHNNHKNIEMLSSKPTSSPESLNSALSALYPPKHTTSVGAYRSLSLAALRVPPDAVLGVDGAKEGRVLVPPEGVQPGGAEGRAVDEHVGLLAVEPALGVLVAAALDGDAAVGDQQLDVAAALPARLRHGRRPVPGHVPVVVQPAPPGRGQGRRRVQGGGYLLVVPALARE